MAMAGSKFRWVLENFSKLSTEDGSYVESPVFCCGFKDGLYAEWKLRLYPGGRKGFGGISLLLYNVHRNCESITVEMAAAFSSDLQSSRYYHKRALFAYDSVDKTVGLGFDDIVTLYKLKNTPYQVLLSDTCDTLRVHCDIETLETAGQPLVVVKPISSFAYMYELYQQNKLTDVTIAVGTQEFHVHKNMLAVSSKVFRAMFDHDLEENISNRVEIHDFNKETVEAFIKFIYTGECEYSLFEANATQLLAFSEKYDVKDLKTKCEGVLARMLEIDNAAELLLLADVHRADELKKSVFNFMKCNMQAVLKSKGWEAVSATKSLATELLASIFD